MAKHTTQIELKMGRKWFITAILLLIGGWYFELGFLTVIGWIMIGIPLIIMALAGGGILLAVGAIFVVIFGEVWPEIKRKAGKQYRGERDE